MCREEVVKILMIVANSYPNFRPDNMSTTADVWTTLLDGYEYKDIQASLMTYIASSNSGFAPSVSQLIAGARKITKKEPDYQNEEEAWSLVYKAICKSTYYSVEEYNKLPALCQKAIGSPDNLRELASGNVDTLQTIEKSLFIKTYRAELERQKQHDLIPKKVKQAYGLENKLYKQMALEQRTESNEPRISEDMKETTMRALSSLKAEFGR